MVEDAEEVKLTLPTMSLQEHSPPIDSDKRNEKGSPLNGQTAKYAVLRSTLNPEYCAKEILAGQSQVETADSLPPYTIQAYKYRLEVFTPDIRSKFARAEGKCSPERIHRNE